jgi:hypothetical protein
MTRYSAAFGAYFVLTCGACIAEEPGPAGAASGDVPLQRAVDGMREAGKRIATRDTGSATREIQRQVVDELNKLIQMARQNQSPAQSRPSQSSQQQDRAQELQKSEDQPEHGRKPQETQKRDPNAGDERKEAQDSQERAGRGKDGQVQTLIQRRLVDAAWGHLPIRLRQKLVNIYDEKTLPQYEELVRRYFEALAEERSNDRRR